MKRMESELPTKWERIYEDTECRSVWKYDSKKNPYGPVSVEYVYKAHVLKAWELYRRRGR